MSHNWPAVPMPMDEMPVAASTFSPSFAALSQRTTWLYNRFQMFGGDGALNAIVLRDQVVKTPDTGVGMVVFWSAANARWEPALADAVAASQLEVMETAYAAALVLSVSGGTATLLFCGQRELASANLYVQSDETFRVGPYWLSATEAGAVTAHKPDVAVYVGFFTTTSALVNVQLRDMAEAHNHVAFALYDQVAGAITTRWEGENTGPQRLVGLLHVGADPETTDQSIIVYGRYSGTGTATYTLTLEEDPADPGLYRIAWSGSDGLSGTVNLGSNLQRRRLTLELGSSGLVIDWTPHSDELTPVLPNTVPLGSQWVFTVPDTLRGWIRTPNSLSELGVYMYNLGFHDALRAVFPPIPLTAASLTLNGVELASSALFPTSAAYTITQSGLGWVSDDPEQWPWSVEEPTVRHRQLVLHLARASTGTTGFVTSLQPKAGSPLRVTRRGTADTATSGDLDLDLELAFETQNTNLAGALAVKGHQGNKLLLGPVVERIVAGDGIEVESVSGGSNGQGIVRIGRTDVSLAGAFDTVALENAKTDKLGMFPYIRLLNAGTGIRSAFTSLFQVPYNLAMADYRAIVYATVFGTTGIASGKQYAGLDFAYSVLPDFYNGEGADTSNLQTVTAAEVSLHADIGFGKEGAAYDAFDPLLIHNDASMPHADQLGWKVLGDPFPTAAVLRPGYTVAVRFTNAAVSPTYDDSIYTGELGILNLRWKLVRV